MNVCGRECVEITARFRSYEEFCAALAESTMLACLIGKGVRADDDD